MANLPTNSLKQEELVGKFQIDDQSNDCFKLNQGIKYPGDLSEFFLIPIEENEISSELEEISNLFSSLQENSQNNADSVWDAFNEEEEQLPPKPEPFTFDKEEEQLPLKPEPYTFEEEEQLPPKPEPFTFDKEEEQLPPKPEPYTFEEEEQLPPKPFDFNENLNVIISNTQIESNIDDAEETLSKDFFNNIDLFNENDILNKKGEDIIFNDINGLSNEKQTNISENSETVQLDDVGINLLSDDLKNLIEQDLKRVKKKKKSEYKNSDSEKLTDEEIKEKIAQFQPIDDLPKSKQFNFDEIDAEYPSAVNKIDVSVSDVFTKEEQKEIKKGQKEKIKKEKILKEKLKKEKPIKEKRKIVIPFTLIWKKSRLPLLIAVLVAVIASYLYINPSLIEEVKNFFTSSDTTKIKDFTLKDSIQHKQLDTINTHIKDTSNEVTKKETDTLTKVVDTAVSLKKDTVQIQEIEENEVKPFTSTITKSIPTQGKKKAEKLAKKVPVVVKDNKYSKPLANQKIVKKKKEKKENQIVKKRNDFIAKNEVEEEIKIIKENKTDINTSEKIENAIYTVEIYSSQSKEDAEEWQKKLQKRGIKTFIVKHYIRDIIWYKVRFGDYPTKSQAATEARNLGFSTFWIDRIK